MLTPAIAVVIPAYNAGGFLAVVVTGLTRRTNGARLAGNHGKCRMAGVRNQGMRWVHAERLQRDSSEPQEYRIEPFLS